MNMYNCRIPGILLLITFSVTSRVKAQPEVLSLENDLSRKHYSFGLSADGYGSSNALNNDFVNACINKSFINPAAKNDAFVKLSDLNRFGGDFDGSIFFGHFGDSLFGKPNSGYFFAFKDRNHLDVSFSRDLFGLAFYGNKKYAGQKADIGNASVNILQYQQIQFGWMRKINKVTLGIGISAIKGQNNISISIPQASLYTEESGEYIDLALQGSIHQTDSLHKNLAAMNGWGTSSDIFFSYTPDSGKTLKIEISDLGYIWWNKHSSFASIDTSYHFEGMEVTDIFNPADSGNTSQSMDSIVRKYLPVEKSGGYQTMLPALFHISFEKNIIEETLNLSAGFRYRLSASYTPFIYVTAKYLFSPKFSLSLTGASGGYGNFTAGLSLSAILGKNFCLSAGSNFLTGILAPRSFGGEGAFLSMKKSF